VLARQVGVGHIRKGRNNLVSTSKMRVLLPLVLPALLPFLKGGVNALATPRDGVILPANVTLEELTKTDPAALVNLFVGTTNGGHSFPGATLPHGLIKVGLDTDSPGNVSVLFSLHSCSNANTNIFYANSKRAMMATPRLTRLVSLRCTTKERVERRH
jgi:hypothetical protein